MSKKTSSHTIINYSRQEDFLNPSLHGNNEFKIIGVGSVGSFITLALSKMGLTNIEVWDDDRIENHNLPNQFYRIGDLNKLKTEALQQTIYEYTNEKIKINNNYFNNQSLGGIVISAVDNLNTRMVLWEKIRNNKNIKYYIDTRMGGNLMQIYIVNPNNKEDINFYQPSLTPKFKLDLPCTGRTILYNILTISGLTASFVTKLLKGEECPRKIIFDLKSLMLYKEER